MMSGHAAPLHNCKYRRLHARDTKLGRDVAIKVLPDEFAGDADRLSRFEREARVLATLNHPHIGAIDGFEEGPAEAGHYVRGSGHKKSHPMQQRHGRIAAWRLL
jgi:serine/threonine protein kinase